MSKHFHARALHPDESDPITYLHAPMGAFLFLLHIGVHCAPGEGQAVTNSRGRPAPGGGAGGRVFSQPCPGLEPLTPVTLDICIVYTHTHTIILVGKILLQKENKKCTKHAGVLDAVQGSQRSANATREGEAQIRGVPTSVLEDSTPTSPFQRQTSCDKLGNNLGGA